MQSIWRRKNDDFFLSRPQSRHRRRPGPWPSSRPTFFSYWWWWCWWGDDEHCQKEINIVCNQSVHDRVWTPTTTYLPKSHATTNQCVIVQTKVKKVSSSKKILFFVLFRYLLSFFQSLSIRCVVTFKFFFLTSTFLLDHIQWLPQVTYSSIMIVGLNELYTRNMPQTFYT